MTDWAPILVTAVGTGVVSSLIATYGTQTRERRQARAQAREAIRDVQNLLFEVPTYHQLDAALAKLETSAMLAGLPQRLTALNRDALFTVRDGLESVSRTPPDDQDEEPANLPDVAGAGDIMFAADHISGVTTKLLIDATWRPILGAPYRWWRTRQLSQVNDARPRPGPGLREMRSWERKAVREYRAKRRS